VPLLPYKGLRPTIAPGVYIADGAMVIGDVTIGEGSSVWYNAVLRGDIAPIRIGRGSNVQDGAVLHVDENVPCVIGDGVVIGHGAVVHSATVGDGALVGMNATLLSGSVVGKQSIVGANALVGEGKEFPDRSLIVGVPGKVHRQVTDEQSAAVQENGQRYVAYAAAHLAERAAGGSRRAAPVDPGIVRHTSSGSPARTREAPAPDVRSSSTE
jgi:carbonic anhydrase/acetyltransferase-like protein (isoleucine patch superfamily)